MRPACPTLSVWTPRVPEPNGNASRTAQTMLPVLIWIDSSAHAQASAHDDGARLAEKAVVVVLLRHRTAASACLTAPSNTLNRALTVQLAALIWVNRNIASFGGDSARVTIVGIGAGAASAQALLAMPRARRYFSQVAAFDGHALRALPACTMPERVPVRADDDVYGSVCIDGKLLQAQIHQSARAGGLAPVPVLLGLSRQPERSNGGLASPCHDSTSAAQLTMEQLAQRAHYAQWLAAEFGPLARDAAHFYPPTTPCRSYLLARYDRQQTYGVLRWADLQTKSSAAVFLAVASAAASAAGTPQQIDRGAWSALLMNNPNALTARGSSPDVDLLMLADTLSDYLVAFATRGDPSTPGRPQWPAYDSGIRNYLELSGNVHTARDPLREVLELHAARSEGTWRP